jgi:hypothetical protein
MADNALLYETLEATKVAAAEDRHVQEVYYSYADRKGHSCQTAGCFAGQRAFLDGYRLGLSYTLERNGETLSDSAVGDYAARRLGLTAFQATVLFDPYNTIEQLEDLVHAIAAGESDSELERRGYLPESDDDDWGDD